MPVGEEMVKGRRQRHDVAVVADEISRSWERVRGFHIRLGEGGGVCKQTDAIGGRGFPFIMVRGLRFW